MRQEAMCDAPRLHALRLRLAVAEPAVAEAEREQAEIEAAMRELTS